MERYKFDDHAINEHCEWDAEGDWVKYSDVVDLQSKLQQTEKALELACDFMAEETDICFWNISGKVANEFGGYDCDLCPRYPIGKCTKDYFLQQAKEAFDG